MQSVRLRGYNRMVCLKGHSQDVDFLCADSGLVVTTSLDGDIRVWDANPMKRRCARVIARRYVSCVCVCVCVCVRGL